MNQPFQIAYPSSPNYGFDKLFSEINGATIADGQPLGPYIIPAADASGPMVVMVYSEGDFNTILPTRLGAKGDPSFSASGAVSTSVRNLEEPFEAYKALQAYEGDDLVSALGGGEGEPQNIETPALPTNFEVQVQFVAAEKAAV